MIDPDPLCDCVTDPEPVSVADTDPLEPLPVCDTEPLDPVCDPVLPVCVCDAEDWCEKPEPEPDCVSTALPEDVCTSEPDWLDETPVG